ncbi:MAG TPA: sigma 54-interacting transcriptional regulator [Candidatus Sulfotelmatobacter sp.]|jgi:DNA-binding NtrC family response regulator|nr:sigma 54-interacting transcriptional regulator [Candidatus Sulfotelmatobacter sp.]
MTAPLALVFDSDPTVRRSVTAALASAGFEPIEADTPQETLEALRARPVAAAVLGIASSRDALFDLVGRAVRLRPAAVVAVLDADAAARWPDALRAGAFEVLPRPPQPEPLAIFAARALSQHRLLDELRRLRASGEGEGAGAIVGRSEAVATLRRRITRLAEGTAPVLFVGERGTGRTHAARALAARGGGDVEVIDAGAPDAEALLFGGARGPDHGALEAERSVHVAGVDALPFQVQERLAAAIVAGSGAGRVTASTVYEPAAPAAEGRLHPSLVAAFGGSVVPIPPLRERREDVAVLARAFLEGLRRLNALPPIAIAPDALARLEAFAWPGNVRDLRDAVETAVILVADGTLRAADLPQNIAGTAGIQDSGVRADRRFREAKRGVVDAFERAYLTDLLARHRGNVTGAAGHAGMLRSALQRLLRKHDLQSAAFRDGPGPPGGRGSA